MKNSRTKILELIKKERKEQIEKHGYTLEKDKRYVNGELYKAAMFCETLNLNFYPEDWSKAFRDKIIEKRAIDRLVIAGALFEAEFDRLGGVPRDLVDIDLARVIMKIENQLVVY